MRRSSGSTPSIGDSAAEHVVAAVEFVRSLDRDHVARLFDHADQLGRAALVLADPAAGPDREVEADLALPNLLLDLPDRVRERQRLVLREPLGRALPDAGQARELGDEPVDGR